MPTANGDDAEDTEVKKQPGAPTQGVTKEKPKGPKPIGDAPGPP